MKIMNHDQSNEQIRLSSNLGEKKIKCFIVINCFLLAFVACAFDIRISRGAVIFPQNLNKLNTLPHDLSSTVYIYFL